MLITPGKSARAATVMAANGLDREESALTVQWTVAACNLFLSQRIIPA